MRKKIIFFIILVLIFTYWGVHNHADKIYMGSLYIKNLWYELAGDRLNDMLHELNENEVNQCQLDIPKIEIDHDQDEDGIKDLDDILEGARKDAANKPLYHSGYYSGGYPPDDEGVCTDVIWRSLKNGGYNLKDMMDKDIKAHTGDYPRVDGKPDPNIDFRRVPNLISFFDKYATLLTTDLVPNDIDNLKEWQGGDIVVFGAPVNHVAIVSDKRRSDGVPYMVHNGGPHTTEQDALLYWHKNISNIVRHYRFPKE